MTPGRPAVVGLDAEIGKFESVADQIALGDLEIRRRFAKQIMLLFVATNVFVMIGLGYFALHESNAIAAKSMVAADRIVDAKVVMALLAATTVQLGTVVYTIARAIFPTPPPAA